MDHNLHDQTADEAAEFELKVEALAKLIRPSLQFADHKEQILHDASHDDRLMELYEDCFDPYKPSSFHSEAALFAVQWLDRKATDLAKQTLSGKETKYTWLVNDGL